MDGAPPTYEELIDLTRRQAARIEALRAEVERLEKGLEEARRAGKRQAAPFSKGLPRADPKRPGRKPGHDTSHRAAPLRRRSFGPSRSPCPRAAPVRRTEVMIGMTRAALLTAAACLHFTDGVPTASATATSAGAGSWPANDAGLTARDAPLSVRVPSGFHDGLERFRAASTPLGGGRDAPDKTVAKTLSVPGNDVDMQEAHETLLAANDDADAKLNRHKCVQNLKVIFLAVDDYHAAHGTLPAAYSVDKGGRPLLSWRVHILPFLGQKPLYDRFHLDEPWDSPHNKALVSLMPADYACPGGSRELAREGKTSYFTPRGPATAFPDSERVTYEQITDGRPSTVLIVEATDSAAVFWTKPEDWDVGREPKTRALFGRHFQGTHFLFADTSVHFIRDSIKPAVLKAIFTRNGNEVVDPDDY